MKRNYLRKQEGYREIVSASEYMEIIKNGTYNIKQTEIIPPELGGYEEVRFAITYGTPKSPEINISLHSGVTIQF
jgi:hypothetical protein